MIEMLDAFGKLNADLFILPEYKQIQTYLTSDYNIDIITNKDGMGSKDLLDLITNNRILTDMVL
jgi:hypothetical protein